MFQLFRIALLLGAVFGPIYAHAQSVVRIPGKVMISQELAEAVFQRLSQDPYASVAPLLGKLQAEVAPQLATPMPQPSPAPESKPEEKK
jgi:hypothetical protein